MKLLDRALARLAALFGRAGNEPQPIVLDRRRIYILPSGGGLLYAATLLAMLLAAINYGLALGYALVFLLAGSGAAGMLHTFRNLHRLRLTLPPCPPIFAGDSAVFPVELDNAGGPPRCALELRTGDGASVFGDLPAGGARRLELPLPTRRRGRLALPALRLATRYPLGLFTAWSVLRPAAECLVYPRPLQRPLPPAAGSGAGSRRAAPDGDEDFAGLRPRQPADNLHHVAWKAAARRPDDAQPLPVKEFAGTTGDELRLTWDAVDGDAETRLSVLCAWVLAAEASARPYALELPGRSIPRGLGAAQRERCLSALALFPA